MKTPTIPSARAAMIVAFLTCGCAVQPAERPAQEDASIPLADSTPVRVAIDARKSFPISRYIYGINDYGHRKDPTNAIWPDGVTLSRFGGNRLTAYNWKTGASNAGRDWNFENDDYLGYAGIPGEATRVRVAGALKRGAGIIVTVPMIGYVSRDMDHTSVGTDPATTELRLAKRFIPSYPSRRGQRAKSSPAAKDAVYQDEFVAWLTGRFPEAARSDTTPLFFGLDNEPDIWGSTHEEILPKRATSHAMSIGEAWSATAGRDLQTRARQFERVFGRSLLEQRAAAKSAKAPLETAHLTYDELIDRTIAFSAAIKAVAPAAMVFGPGTATWTGVTTLGRWPLPDPHYAGQLFLDVYLDRLRAAELATHRRVLDVLDIHWYPATAADGAEIGDDMAPQTPQMTRARLQAPRSLWDPTYDERSWVSGVQNGPIRLLPLLREHIAAHYPGTKIAITEYYYGRGGDISGGIAQADVLGIFGREGVFAATLWPNGNPNGSTYGGNLERTYRYVVGAFRMYRNFDAAGGAFGNVGLTASTSDPVGTSVYASTDDSALTRVVIVAINKGLVRRLASMSIDAPHGWRSARVYTLTESAAAPQRAPALQLDGATRFKYEMPPMSVSTLVLTP